MARDADDGVVESEAARLRVENAELRRRIEATEHMIDELRTEALVRRAEVRELAEALPIAMSRRTLVRQMLSDAKNHPDKSGLARRAAANARHLPHRAKRRLRRLLP